MPVHVLVPFGRAAPDAVACWDDRLTGLAHWLDALAVDWYYLAHCSSQTLAAAVAVVAVGDESVVEGEASVAAEVGHRRMAALGNPVERA